MYIFKKGKKLLDQIEANHQQQPNKKFIKCDETRLTMLFAFGCDDIGHVMEAFRHVYVHIMYFTIIIIVFIIFFAVCRKIAIFYKTNSFFMCDYK